MLLNLVVAEEDKHVIRETALSNQAFKMLTSTLRSGSVILTGSKRLSYLVSRKANLSTNVEYKPIKSILVANRGTSNYTYPIKELLIDL